MCVQSRPTLLPFGLWTSRLLICGIFWGKNSGVGCHFLLQGSSWNRDQTQVSFIPCMAGGFFTTDPLGSPVTHFSAVQVRCSVVSDSLWPHELQHARPPRPSSTPGGYSDSCPLSRWCHPTISSSVVPFSSHFQAFQASGSFLMSQFFASGGQSIGVSTSASVLPMNIQEWFPLGWTGWISLQSKALLRVFSNTTVQKHQLFISAFFIVHLSHPYMTTGKTIALTRWTLLPK